jgi:hypothetical protein
MSSHPARGDVNAQPSLVAISLSFMPPDYRSDGAHDAGIGEARFFGHTKGRRTQLTESGQAMVTLE